MVNFLLEGCGLPRAFYPAAARHGYAVEGPDVSAKMIELARERDPEVTFHHAYVCKWEPNCLYDFITARDSLWHVPLEEHARALERLCKALNPGGVRVRHLESDQ